MARCTVIIVYPQHPAEQHAHPRDEPPRGVMPDHPILLPVEIALTLLANKGPSAPEIIKLWDSCHVPRVSVSLRELSTVEYYPPENRVKGKYHAKSAVPWSLEVILFMMLCGRFPTCPRLN
ncbi:hypothetical protein G5714_020244 [Onychostoma macrolepis]|uniref:non-specific serine/threonine protein kinase n=1 Tax=Onychostoma macrolepis TaxID=369639 RepID=A0A7J6BTT7_9TELE|nr:hypothetical protein G5714_020244 [Onychostoma macrolepis]